ncbi:MAG: hypothetical protein VXV96_05415 [Bdellovibrionota bacterium]|nr:hypothetical protein [Bdellovibrionota bacterium]
MKIWITFFSLILTNTFALEIDEKLTTRFIKVSSTKKTVLLNRGLEDGLVVGDHAKFFLTTGVIARGVVVKASPTRTIWSIYRIVNDSSIYADKVVNIKITKPITTTVDPSKSLYDNSNSTMSPGTEVMSFRGGAAPGRVRTMETESQSVDQQELASLGAVDDESAMLMRGPGLSSHKTIEAFGLVHLNSLSSSVDEGDGDTFSGNDANIDFSVGLEKYFDKPNSFLGRISFAALFHASSRSMTSAQGQQVSNSVTEYGAGAFYHYIAPPLSYGRLIGFSGLTLGVGSVSDTIDLLSASSNQVSTTASGSSSFFSVATGVKYYTESGFGARAVLDYYQRSESYELENGDTYNKTVSGPRLLLGLSYRF